MCQALVTLLPPGGCSDSPGISLRIPLERRWVLLAAALLWARAPRVSLAWMILGKGDWMLRVVL